MICIVDEINSDITSKINNFRFDECKPALIGGGGMFSVRIKLIVTKCTFNKCEVKKSEILGMSNGGGICVFDGACIDVDEYLFTTCIVGEEEDYLLEKKKNQ